MVSLSLFSIITYLSYFNISSNLKIDLNFQSFSSFTRCHFHSAYYIIENQRAIFKRRVESPSKGQKWKSKAEVPSQGVQANTSWCDLQNSESTCMKCINSIEFSSPKTEIMSCYGVILIRKVMELEWSPIRGLIYEEEEFSEAPSSLNGTSRDQL